MIDGYPFFFSFEGVGVRCHFVLWTSVLCVLSEFGFHGLLVHSYSNLFEEIRITINDLNTIKKTPLLVV